MNTDAEIDLGPQSPSENPPHRAWLDAFLERYVDLSGSESLELP